MKLLCKKYLRKWYYSYVVTIYEVILVYSVSFQQWLSLLQKTIKHDQLSLGNINFIGYITFASI